MTVGFSGIGSGLDLSSLVEGLYQAERLPIRNVQAKKAQTNQRISLVGDLMVKLETLAEQARSLDAANELRAVATTVGDETVLDASASSDAAVASYSIDVTQLAQSQSNVTGAFATTDPFGSGTLSIQVGTDPIVDVDYDTSMTLYDIADAINVSDAPVSASVLDDGNGFRLVIQGDDTGVESAFTLSDSGTLTTGVTELRAAQDALFDVDGLSITRSTNQVADLFTGVSLELSSVGTTTVNVTEDAEGLREKMQGFVDAYNDVATFLTSNLSTTEGVDPSALFGDSSVRSLQRRLGGLVSSGFAHGGQNIALGNVGITLNRNGTIEIDAATFDGSMSTDPAALSSIFAGDGTNGLSQLLDAVADEYTEVGTGLLAAKQDGMRDRIEDYDRQIERIEAHAQAVRDRLTKTFTALDTVMTQLQSQADYLASALSQ